MSSAAEAALRVKDPELLERCRAVYRETNSFKEVEKQCGISYNTLMKQKKAGLFDLEDVDTEAAITQKIGPERVRAITEMATELTLAAQKRVKEDLPNASAAAASRIAVEQNNIRIANEGRVADVNVFVSGGDLADGLRRIFGEQDGDVVDGEVVEDDPPELPEAA